MSIADAVAFISMIAGVAAAYFGWRAIPRRRPAPPPPAQDGQNGQNSRTTVFVAFAGEDRDWVRTLAKDLQAAQIRVFFDEWDIAPGDVIVDRLEAGIGDATAAVLVLSEVSITKPWLRLEYSALLHRSVQDGIRFIPLVLGRPRLPAFAQAHATLDFTDAAEYQHNLNRLLASLRG